MKKDYIVELREDEAEELMEEHWVGELVRCKDCVFRDDRDGMCEHVQQVRDPDWYCADGERKDDND